jgi:predicted permease
MKKIKEYVKRSFDVKNNHNIYFLFPALVFMGVGIYTKDATYIALGAVFIALSGSTYTKPPKK